MGNVQRKSGLLLRVLSCGKGALSQLPLAINPLISLVWVNLGLPNPWTNVCAQRDVVTGQLWLIRAHSWSWGQTARPHGERGDEEETSESLRQFPSRHTSGMVTYHSLFYFPPKSFYSSMYVRLRYNLLFWGSFALLYSHSTPCRLL